MLYNTIFLHRLGVIQECGVVWARCEQLCLISITMATSISMVNMLLHVISTFKWKHLMN